MASCECCEIEIPEGNTFCDRCLDGADIVLGILGKIALGKDPQEVLPPFIDEEEHDG